MGSTPARVIGIDVGTSGVRAAALADDGATVGSAAVAMETFGDATAPATWWTCVRAVISKLGSSCDLSQVRALAAARVDPELLEWSYDFVGDLAETVSLIWPAAAG